MVFLSWNSVRKRFQKSFSNTKDLDTKSIYLISSTFVEKDEPIVGKDESFKGPLNGNDIFNNNLIKDEPIVGKYELIKGPLNRNEIYNNNLVIDDLSNKINVDIDSHDIEIHLEETLEKKQESENKEKYYLEEYFTKEYFTKEPYRDELDLRFDLIQRQIKKFISHPEWPVDDFLSFLQFICVQMTTSAKKKESVPFLQFLIRKKLTN